MPKENKLMLSPKTPTNQLVQALFGEMEEFKLCKVDDQKNMKRLMHNISAISKYIDKRWSH